VAVRYFVAFLLAAGMSLSVFGQSGRRPRPTQSQPPASTQGAEKNKQSEGQSSEKDDDRKTSNKPLADNTPTTVTEDGTIKLDTALVTISASVIDREGRFIPDLKKRDFRIFEDGVEQDIESFESVATPFHVVLALDTSASTRFRLEDIQAAAVAFVNQLSRDDRVMVVSFDSAVHLECDFTDDRRRLRDAIYNTRTGGSTKLYEAVDLSLSDGLGRIQGRKAVVLFTDGVDTASRRSSARSTIEMVEESDVLVFPIRYDTEGDNVQGGVIGSPRGPIPWPMPPTTRNPRTPSGRSSRWPFPFVNYQFPGQWPQGRLPVPGGGAGDYTRGAQYLQDLADRSGGRLYYADSLQNLSDAFSKIAEELRYQYALSYYPTNGTRDGSYRQIKIQIKRPNTIVRARDGYRAVPEGQTDNPGTKDNRKRPEFKRRILASK
jgi:VWFA-related protein